MSPEIYLNRTGLLNASKMSFFLTLAYHSTINFEYFSTASSPSIRLSVTLPSPKRSKFSGLQSATVHQFRVADDW